MQTEDYLHHKKKSTDMNKEKWELLDRKMLGAVRLSLSSFMVFSIFKEKRTEKVEWEKARVQDQIGCERFQTESIDFIDIFSSSVKLPTRRAVLSSVTAEDLPLEELDVKSIFLYGDLNEDLYMRLLEACIEQVRRSWRASLK